jgi:DNA repair protein RecN (Recombination protein N)
VLTELRVSQLGVIEDVRVLLDRGMTALTGETGAGKTLLVDAIQLLLGGPSESMMVRAGATEAAVEGRFVSWAGDRSEPAVDGIDEEVVLARIVPASGRSRAYLDGRMVAAAQLADAGLTLIDLHGQHAQQTLLAPSAQRAALDRAGGISTDEVSRARRRIHQIEAAQEALGGDARTRARELDLLQYQLTELEAAGLEDPDEDDFLQEEEERLADASGLRDAATTSWQALTGDDGIVDGIGSVVAAIGGRKTLAELEVRLRALAAELADVAADARTVAEAAEDDPARLAAVGSRRKLLTEIRRKYGETLATAMDYRDDARRRLAELMSHESRAAQLEAERRQAEADLRAATEALWSARRAAAPEFGRAVEAKLRELAMPKARFEVEIGPDAGSEAVTWKLGANPGQPLLPLTKVASGGELARTMLATRLVIGGAAGALGDNRDSADLRGPPSLIFDEVDAGIGGEAAVAVGRALAALARHHQVLVVTHLPQVAAFADHQLVVQKDTVGDRTVATVNEVRGPDRVIELSRMLSGSPDSETARRHAEELLSRASAPANRSGKHRPGKRAP